MKMNRMLYNMRVLITGDFALDGLVMVRLMVKYLYVVL